MARGVRANRGLGSTTTASGIRNAAAPAIWIAVNQIVDVCRPCRRTMTAAIAPDAAATSTATIGAPAAALAPSPGPTSAATPRNARSVPAIFCHDSGSSRRSRCAVTAVKAGNVAKSVAVRPEEMNCSAQKTSA